MARPAPSVSTTVGFVLVVAVVLGGLLLDVLLAPSEVQEPQPTDVPLLAGTSTCAAIVLDPTSQITVATAADVPDDEVRPASAQLLLEDDGTARALLAPDTTGRTIATAVAGSGGEVSVSVRWDGAPMLLSRRWSLDTSGRVPGTVEGPCPEAAGPLWYVPGVATAGGASATLHLANPTSGAASLGITFTTPDGPIAPTRLANLVVPALGSTTIDLNEFAPEEPDLGVVVTTRAGRVVAEVLQTLEAAVGGVDGRSLVVAHTQPRETWTIPWVSAGEGETAWVWVTNPSDQPTDVRLVLHTASGPVVPPASGVTLAPGTTQRIDLRGALGDIGAAGVTVRSAPGVGIVASAAVLRAVEDDPVRGGIAVVEALPGSGGRHAALSSVGASGRDRFLVVTNPGDEQAVVSIRTVGRNALAPRIVSRRLVVPAGASRTIDLDDSLPLEGGFAVHVDVSEGVVASVMVATSDEGPLDLVAAAARPFPSTVTVIDLPERRDRTLLHPIDRSGPVGSEDVDVDADVDAEPGVGDDEAPSEPGTDTDADTDTDGEG